MEQFDKDTKESFIEKVLVIDGPEWTGRQIKDKLFEFKLKDDICEICGLGPVWNGKELSLELDHTNGNHIDNMAENLRIVCPNCHSQLKNFNGVLV